MKVNGTKNHRLRLCSLLLLQTAMCSAQTATHVLTLDSCRAMALSNNKELRMAQGKTVAAMNENKAAYTKFLPRINALGAYAYTSREVSLLSDGQKELLGNLGTSLSGILGPNMVELLNQGGQDIVKGFRTDTRNIYTAAVTVTQPLYAGGKITAYNQITQLNEKLAQQQLRTSTQNVLLATDKSYWLVVSLEGKQKLAKSYLELVNHLQNDVQKMLDEGVATKADLLSVMVKVNEAEMQLTQVEDGLTLSRMALCQICGMDLDSQFNCQASAASANDSITPLQAQNNVQTAWNNRPEVESLELAAKMYEQKVKVVRADHLPTVGLTGGYILTNPSCFNGFENKFKGMWNVGVAVSVPVFSFREGTYKTRAAKAEAMNARTHCDEVKEKIELQVRQAGFKVNEAEKKMKMALRDCERAEENLRFARLGFGEGVIPVSDVIAAQTMWLKAQTAREDAEIEQRTSLSELKRALGTLE